MRTSAVLSLAFALVVAACSDDEIVGPDNRFSAQDTFAVNVTNASRQELILSAVNGTVSITGVSGATAISIFAVKRVEAPTQADADARISGIDVNVDSTSTPDALTVETDQPNNTAGRNYLVYYAITVPDDFNLVVNAANGEVTLKDINSPVTVNQANGTVLLDDIVGTTQVGMANGTVDGRVTMPTGGTIDFNLANGEIALEIPQSTSAQFSAEVEIGSVTVVGLNLQNAQVERNRVTGTLGAGEGMIDLDIANGEIFVEGF
jgi:hypothetical protein